MFKLKWLNILGVFLCLLSLAACAAPGVAIRDEPVGVELSGVKSGDVDSGSLELELKLDPNVVRGELANGFSYYLLKNSTPENRVSMHLNVQAGSMNETEAERGLAHYLEHMLFNGSTHFKPGELIEYFQSIGMGFGADANAHTGFYETVYDIFLPKGDDESIDKGLLVLDDFARGALILESEVDRERGVILAEKRERDSVGYRTFKETLAFEIPGARLTKRLPIGIDEVIKTADRNLLKGFYDAWYRPDNMMIVAVGDFDINTLEKKIIQRFSGMTARAEKRELQENSWVDSAKDRAFYHHEPEAGSTTVTIQKVRPVPFEKDTLGSLKKRCVIDLAGAVVGNRLSRLVRQNGSLLTGAGIYSDDSFHGVHYSVIGAGCDPGEWKNSLDLVNKTLEQALEFGFSDQECKRVKANYIKGLETELKEASTRRSEHLARGIIRKVNRKRVFQSPAQEYDILAEFVDSLTPDQLVRAFRKEWSKGPWQVLVTGNAVIDQDLSTPADEVILRAFQTSRAKKVLPPAIHESVSYPYLPQPERGGAVKAERTIEALDVKIVEFENKVTLNLKQTDFTKGEFIFTLAFGHGLKGEPGSLPAVGDLAINVINESGFGGIDRDQIGEALAGRNVNVRFDGDHGSLLIRGSAGSEESELVFQLIRNYFLDPGFRQSSLDLVKERYRQMHQRLLGTPQGLMALEGERFLAGGDKRFGLPSLAEIEGLTLADIKSWIKLNLERGGIELSIVGDFNLEQIIDDAGTYLVTLPERRELQALPHRSGPVFPAGETLELTVNTKLDKALVQMTFLTDDFWDASRVRHLNVLSQIFSDRLRQNIREKLGASYSPFAYNQSSLFYEGYGLFCAVVNADPDTVETIVKEVKTIALSIVEDGVTEKEVALAVKPLITKIKDLQKTNEYWLENVLSESKEHPERFEWAKTILDAYGAIDVDGVNRVARDYLKVEEGAFIIVKSGQ